MREIGAFEAKNRLGQLLDWVEAGEEVIITRRGRAVAPGGAPKNAIVDRERALGAAARIHAPRRGVTLGGI
jgi:antitoxin (DNA-binding transcriptional repressor) of toxin-antitoxin stability system